MAVWKRIHSSWRKCQWAKSAHIHMFVETVPFVWQRDLRDGVPLVPGEECGFLPNNLLNAILYSLLCQMLVIGIFPPCCGTTLAAICSALYATHGTSQVGSHRCQVRHPRGGTGNSKPFAEQVTEMTTVVFQNVIGVVTPICEPQYVDEFQHLSKTKIGLSLQEGLAVPVAWGVARLAAEHTCTLIAPLAGVHLNPTMERASAHAAEHGVGRH